MNYIFTVHWKSQYKILHPGKKQIIRENRYFQINKNIDNLLPENPHHKNVNENFLDLQEEIKSTETINMWVHVKYFIS